MKASGTRTRSSSARSTPQGARSTHGGYEVLPDGGGREEGRRFITTTGNRDVITREDFEEMQDGVLLANAGHFDVEVNLDDLDDPRRRPLLRGPRRRRRLRDGRRPRPERAR